MQELTLSSITVALGPEGIMVGTANAYEPPADMAQLADAMTRVRRDLRELGAGFKAVYLLKLGLEEKIAKTASTLESAARESASASAAALRRDLREQAANDLERLQAVLSEFNAEIAKRLEAAERILDNRFGELSAEAARAAGANERNRQEILDRIAGVEIESQRNIQESADRTVAVLGEVETRICDRLTVSIAAESRAIALQFIAADQKSMRLHKELLVTVQRSQGEIFEAIASHAAEQAQLRESLRDEILAAAEQARADAWPILWVSFKTSFKRLFKRKGHVEA